MAPSLPATQRALHLVGPGALRLDPEKPVIPPGPHQVLGRVEVVGLCFSDIKLLHQFAQHPRKSAIRSGIPASVLAEIPSYVPDTQPTVPGHETVVRVVAVGSNVSNVRAGKRYLVQTDYRWLKTGESNAAFGYNFEGALQEYVLMDQRVCTSPDGESMLIPASESLSASSVALVEPWACVEHACAAPERQTLKPGGRLLVLGDSRPVDAFLRQPQATPGEIIYAAEQAADGSIDDLLFLGANADELERVLPKMANGGLINVVQCGQTFDRPVSCPIGRIHYSGLRITGTAGADPAEALARIPPSGEIRTSDRVDVVGAGGPMGAMQVIRALCRETAPRSVCGGDISPARLETLTRLARPLAAKHGVAFSAYHAESDRPDGPVDYIILMVPSPQLVADSVARAAPGGIVNIFAGIATTVHEDLDLDTYIHKSLYFIGTSGSLIDDMRVVLNKVTQGSLDTDLSVAAVAGLEGAMEGIRAVEEQRLPGKILVYPSCRGLGLTPLSELAATHPRISARLNHGIWTRAAETELLSVYADPR